MKVPRQNGPVRRLFLLAIGLSALLWTAGARAATAPADIVTMSAAGSYLTDGSQKPSDSDKQWHPPQRTIAAITESSWKSMPVQAAPAGTDLARVFEITSTGSSPGPTAPSTPLYLRHTPLLI
jgi:hypothetical protein